MLVVNSDSTLISVVAVFFQRSVPIKLLFPELHSVSSSSVPPFLRLSALDMSLVSGFTSV